MKTTSSKGHVPFISKFAYGMGDVGCNFSWMFVSNFLMIFYTDVFGIGMSAVATLMLVSRIWDAVNDPIIGTLTDKTHSRWGRFRPWLLFGAPRLEPDSEDCVHGCHLLHTRARIHLRKPSLRHSLRRNDPGH